MRPPSIAAGALAACFLLCFSGCLELVKRTEPPWEGEAPRTGTVREQSPATPPSKRLKQTDSVSAGIARVGRSGAPTRVKAAPLPLTRQTNRFALWSIRRGMWKEARRRLEKHAERDSASGALQNNLGIVYEYMSLTDRAETAYGRAVALEPRNMVYAENFRRFRRNKVSANERYEGAGASADSSGAPADTSIADP